MLSRIFLAPVLLAIGLAACGGSESGASDAVGPETNTDADSPDEHRDDDSGDGGAFPPPADDGGSVLLDASPDDARRTLDANRGLDAGRLEDAAHPDDRNVIDGAADANDACGGSRSDAGAVDASVVDAGNDADADDCGDGDALADATTNAAADAGDGSSINGRHHGPRFFRPILLNNADKSPEVILTPDRLSMQIVSLGRAGVRSDTAVRPGSGIFYFEGERLVQAPWMAIGVATAAVALDSVPSETDQGFSIDTGDGSWFDPAATSHYGFVVDYRQAHPTVYLVAETFTGRGIAFSTTLTKVVDPLYIFVGGLRRNVGPQASINAGNDIVNFPFFYDPVASLKAAGIAGADALVLGWGDSYAGKRQSPPTIEVSADQTITLGSQVVVTAKASDPEDGDLTAKVQWGDRATPLGVRVFGTGGRFTLVPGALGLHELSARVTDSGGKVASASVRVTVTGTLPTFDPVRLQPDATTGSGIVLTADGLGAHYTGLGKMAIRANQGLLRGFQYFEMHREITPANVGGGLVTADGNLNPYGPTDVPPSCSVNVLGGTWRQLMFNANFTDAQAAESYYGFAVDYRGASPIVYVIVLGSVADTIRLTDATVPVYPMLYGNPVTSGTTPDETINFGTRPFHYDPATILRAAGIDLTGFQAGWGVTKPTAKAP